MERENNIKFLRGSEIGRKLIKDLDEENRRLTIILYFSIGIAANIIIYSLLYK